MRVMVALDGTPIGESALATIAPWAAASGAEVVLLTVRNPSGTHETLANRNFVHALTPMGTASGQKINVAEPAAVASEDRTQALERVRVDTQEWLQSLAQHYLPGVTTTVAVEWASDVVDAIAKGADRHQADFIAMGTHGRSGMKHVLMGSVAEGVLRHANVPVLMVRQGMRVPMLETQDGKAPTA